MLPSMRMIGRGMVVMAWGFWTSQGMAAGLDQLSEAHPAKAGAAPTQGAPVGKGEGPAKVDTKSEENPSPDAKDSLSVQKSVTSKALAGRLAVGSSYGWILGSRMTGSWSAKGGMADLVVAYRLQPIAKNYEGTATYRYAPMSVVGRQDGQSYSGIWEAHYAGLKMSRSIKGATAHGSLEVGYVLSHVAPTDGLPERKSAEAGGVSLVLGGGADIKVLEQLAVGPRVHVGLGTVRTVQVAAGANFAF